VRVSIPLWGYDRNRWVQLQEWHQSSFGMKGSRPWMLHCPQHCAGAKDGRAAAAGLSAG
jgi:hypothetical protein